MNQNLKKRNFRRGAMTPFLMIMLPVLLLLSAFAINLAYLQLTKTELKVATDLSTRAAGRTYALSSDPSVALAKANELGQLNQVDGKPMQFAMQDLQIGNSVRTALNRRYDFTPAAQGNSVQLTGRKSNSAPAGPVRGFLASLVGASTFDLTESSVSTQTEVDVVLVFDTSGSMAYSDDEVAVFPPGPKSKAKWKFGDAAPPNARWFDAVRAAGIFLTELSGSPQNEQVALVTYADGATLEAALTSDYNKLTPALNSHSKRMKGGGTNIAGGIDMAQVALKSSRDFSGRAVIVLTDGRKTVGGSPLTAASKLADKGVLVFTVTFSDEADKNLMKKVAERGNGKHFHASNGDELANVFAEIGRQLPNLITR